MKMPKVSLMEWQHRFSTEEACTEALIRVRWPDGFICPVCVGKAYSYISFSPDLPM
jgi:hypothetical protein